MNKAFFENLIATRKKQIEEAQRKIDESQNVDEVRSFGSTLATLRQELADAEAQLRAIDEEEDKKKKEEEEKKKKEEGRSLNPMASFGQGGQPQTRGSEDPRESMEYRTAFMNFVQRGTKSDVLQFRGNDQNESGDLGVLLPITIVQEIMKGVEHIYGQLYSKVKKTNVKGGVKYPIGAFDATFHRIGENGAPTDRQNGGSMTGFVEFSYKMGEIRLAQTLLASVLSVPVFEAELSKVIVEAYVKAMDVEILVGGDSTLAPTEYQHQMEGIITEANKASGSRIIAGNIIEFTAQDMADWKKWQKNLFAKIPLSMRALRPEFVMTANTYEANIKTLHDDNNRPLANETFNPVDGAETATFKGRQVTFVEEGIGIYNFDDATNGQYFGIYWVPDKAYAINTNLEFAVKRYFDEEKLQWVDRAVVINDGKILDPKYIWLLKKKV